jgi:hypothetical protein
MNRFFNSLDRAMDAVINPGDVSIPHRLWAIRCLAVGAAVYLSYCSPSSKWTDPLIASFFFGSLLVLMIVSEIRKLWIRVERLESEAKLRQASDSRPAEALFSN